MHRQEGNEQIRLDGQDPTLVRKTLEFLYTGNYTYKGTPEDPETESTSEAETEVSSENETETSLAHPRTGEAYFHAQMYAQGAYFQIDALKSKAKQRFEESFMIDPFDRDGFTSAVIEVYSSTEENDRGLRDLLVRLTTYKLYTLRDRRPVLRGNPLRPILDENLLERIPSFMRDMCISAINMCEELQLEERMRGGWDY